MALLKDIADVQTGPFGSQLHKEDYVMEGTPIVTVEHLGNRVFTEQNLPMVSDKDRDRLSKYVLKEGDTVFSRVGSVDRCSYVDALHSGWMFSGRCLRVRPNDLVNPEYLYYFFTTEDTKQLIRNIAVGATMPSINTKILSEVDVPLPDLLIQKRIASVLSAIDEKIDINSKINRNLLEQTEALFKSWFEDFEPWNGIMPENWKQGVLGDFVTIKRGGSPRPIQEFLSDDGLRWLKISDVSGLQSPYILDIAEHIIEAGLKKTVHLGEGALVLSNSATPGIPKILDVDSCIHDGWLYFPESQLSNYFLFLFFKSIRSNLVALGNGSVFTNLKTDILKNYSFSKPDIDTLNQFDELVTPMFVAMREVARENHYLSELRDSLLPKLMSGELDISDLDI